MLYVQVVDPNRSRGREIARHLVARSFCVELYEGLSDVLSRRRCGVVLVSDDHEATDPVKALEVIAGCAGYTPVAFFSSSLSPRRVVRAMSAGVIDYFEWPCSPTKLGEIVVRLIVQGERRANIDMLRTQARELVAGLLERERHVLRCVMAGASDAQIARELGIGPDTAEIHRLNMMSRLAAGSVSDAVRIGIYAGLDEFEVEPRKSSTPRREPREEISAG